MGRKWNGRKDFAKFQSAASKPSSFAALFKMRHRISMMLVG